MISSKKYCDELSRKMHQVMEQKSVQDFSSQCIDEGKDIKLKSLEDRINYLEDELVQAVSEKEDIQNDVREEYDDILGNLRGDLDESRERYKSLQEENFSLKKSVRCVY